MSLAAITSVVRHAGVGQPSSFLRILDVEALRVVATAAVPESDLRAIDPNPRGGMRGARGVSALSDRLCVAQNERILVLDTSWNITATLSHPLLGGIHDIVAERRGIWVTSTSADSVVFLDWRGDVRGRWLWREDTALVRQLGFESLPAVDFERDYRVPRVGDDSIDLAHINGVASADDSLVVTMGRILSPSMLRTVQARGRLKHAAVRAPGVRRVAEHLRRQAKVQRSQQAVPASAVEGSSFAVVRVCRDEGKVRNTPAHLLLHVQGTTVPNHNAIVLGDRVVYNDSNRCKLIARTAGSGEIVAEVEVPGEPGFARGLAHLGGDQYLVGSQNPASIHKIHLNDGFVAGSVDLCGVSQETVFAIAQLPARFARPARLPWSAG